MNRRKPVGSRNKNSINDSELTKLGEYVNTVEKMIVCKSSIKGKVPFTNCPVYINENNQIGVVNEAFGKMEDYMVTIKPMVGYNKSTFLPNQEFLIPENKLLPIARLQNLTNSKMNPKNNQFSSNLQNDRNLNNRQNNRNLNNRQNNRNLNNRQNNRNLNNRQNNRNLNNRQNNRNLNNRQNNRNLNNRQNNRVLNRRTQPINKQVKEADLKPRNNDMKKAHIIF